jgi:hypothetical protein
VIATLPIPDLDERGRILNRMAALLRERFDEIVELESLDAGKPISATRRQDVPAAIDCLEYYAGWADKLAGEVVPVRHDAFTYTTLAPVGVLAAIVPWNFPLMRSREPYSSEERSDDPTPLRRPGTARARLDNNVLRGGDGGGRAGARRSSRFG